MQPALPVLLTLLGALPAAQDTGGDGAARTWRRLLERHAAAGALHLAAEAVTRTTVHYRNGAGATEQRFRVLLKATKGLRGRLWLRDESSGEEQEFLGDGERFWKVDASRRPLEAAPDPLGWMLSSFEFLKPFYGKQFQSVPPESVRWLPPDSAHPQWRGLEASYAFRPSGFLTEEGYVPYEERPDPEALERFTIRAIETVWLDADGLPARASVERRQRFGGPGEENAPLTIRYELDFSWYDLPEAPDGTHYPGLPPRSDPPDGR